MKTKITTIAFAAILFTLPISAQESYLPVLYGNTVHFFYAIPPVDYDDCGISGDVYLKDADKQRTYVAGYAAPYDMLEYSEDNSKLWGYNPSFYFEEWWLLMDLNLEVGDKYSYPYIYETCVVTDVYYKDGRKYIEFDRLVDVVWRDIEGNIQKDKIPFMFIEGVGMNTYDYGGRMILSKFIDKIQDYSVPESEAYEDDCFLFSVPNNIVDIKKGSIAITFLSSASIQVHIPAEIINSGAQLNIVDTMGKLIKSVNVTGKEMTVDVSNFPSGTYLLQVSSFPNYTRKFIKK